jgi:DNA-binding MarR family transcriptional regulator
VRAPAPLIPPVTQATQAPQPALDADTAARLRAVIGKLSRRLRPTASATAAALTPTRTAVILTVVREGRIRLSELAAAEGINPTMLSRVIADLAQAGFVERTCDQGDRRAAWITATPAGKRLVERIRRERTDALNAALGNLGDVDLREIQQALPALESLAEALGTDVRP